MNTRRRLLPAEASEQSGVLLTWPHRQSDWQAVLAQVEPVYIEIARAITAHESLLIVCRDTPHRHHVEHCLQREKVTTGRVRYFEIPSDDTWTRDYGPITVIADGAPRLLDFVFNGWGGKFTADLDDRVTRHLHTAGAFGNVALDTVPLVLEGGSIDTDGQGSLLTTSRCLLSPGRNPSLDRDALERELGRLLGVDRFLWLDEGQLEGDDTDAHVDTLARFCDPHTIAYVRCDDPADGHYHSLSAMERELASFRDRHGQPYRLVPLPWPQAKHDDTGRRLPASYANFLIINGAVLLPTYDDPADGEAVSALRRCFPDRKIIPIVCTPLLHQNGSLHCVTMHLPAGVI